uniref:non-specific serine/threonine protein kinase n=1 Tax=Esox lucius TaxID=8010 RepID=A0A3P8Z337_ESOLU
MSGTGIKVKNSVDLLHERAAECRQNGYLLSAKKIGTGAFSKVYLGYATPDKISRNYKLAFDLKSKNHNMVQLYDTFRSPRRFYLILELALRGDLLEHINAVSHRKDSPGLCEEEARRLFKQIVNAVKHCHNNQIVHRDLKCENILLDERGFVKLTDFGFACHYTDRSALMNTFCGSVAYTAPEILLCRKYCGEQADLWSLGVILYAMVMGKLPYHEKHPRKLIQLIRKELPFNHPISSGCQELIQKLLQWQPSARIPLHQVTTHHWMTPSLTGTDPDFRLRATKSDIVNKSMAFHRTLKEEPIGPVVGRSCQSGSDTRPSFRRSQTSRPGGPHRTTVSPQTHFRPGARSACCHRHELPQREEPPPP